jgi:hypothetical protein
LQLVQSRFQALRDLRQLTPEQGRHLGWIAGLIGGITKNLQRLKQILDVMGHPGTGFVDGLNVTHALQLVGLKLDQIELDSQPQQPLDMPAHGG